MAPGGPEIVDQEPKEDESSSDIQVNRSQSHSSSRPQLILSSTGMESVRFEELELQIGEPYWMLHQGNCEHIFTVDDIRAVHPTDPNLPKVPNGNILPTIIEGCYPITTFLSRLTSPKCRVCDRDPAKLVIMNDELVDESPCFVCERCFELLHGHETGFRIGKVAGREWWVVPLLGS
ncbi:uncharacterized protein MELLADRAFT_71692 [Melampsora larici-populina 98AG31]|uniref:snRNA-activating protein complex subunit 3 n=1 Tax=Melampsora larici-populina (strain 98AG31 / pathotype 3-4-7) TaxID=747676 RepID=F4RJJ3_MELLP|nr:uncharacterized protein MELLADRAFT_71692 [Melampsora larici-populina 98AG31]EGG07481.1 hypothetical protein MELLADRAFT_71692 [Melampsora larici-populina 98AG31]